MNLQRLFDISQARDLDSFRSNLVGFAEHLGFPLVTAALVVDSATPNESAAFHVLSNMPEAFKNTSKDPALSKKDPVNRRLKTLSVPFLYDKALYVSEGAADLWDLQAPFGYCSGIAVALHLPNNQHFLLGVDREPNLPRSEAKVMRLMADIQLLAVHAQSAATTLLAPQVPVVDVPRLTPREFEVMQWTKEGKSAWDTSVLVGISEATVNFHIRNVCAKMGCASKHQAVLKAMQLGILG